MKDENYIVITGWMINQLKLNTKELIIYAIIYGFSQDEESEYNGSLSYLAKCINSTKKTVIETLKKLVNKKLIIKTEVTKNGIKFCKYKTNMGGVKITPGWCKNYTGGGIKITPNNNSNYNISINTTINNKNKKFIKPTIEEIKAYCKERKNNVDAEVFYDFYESKGWVVGKSSMKDWKAAVRTWERNRNNTSSKPKEETKSIYQTYEEYVATEKEREEYYRNLCELQREASEQSRIEFERLHGGNTTEDIIEELEDW